jgi:hypothetical protein
MTSRKGNAECKLTCEKLPKGAVSGFDGVQGKVDEKMGSLGKMAYNVKEEMLRHLGEMRASLTDGKRVGRFQLSPPDYC